MVTRALWISLVLLLAGCSFVPLNSQPPAAPAKPLQGVRPATGSVDAQATATIVPLPTQRPVGPPPAPEVTIVPQPRDAAGAPPERPLVLPPRPTIQVALPYRVKIPRLAIDAVITPVRQDAKGRMDTPKDPDEVAWYELGPRPGEASNAILAGHRDGKNRKPGVFARLKELQANDEVVVVSSLGVSYAFTIEWIEQHPGQEAPLERVFGATPGATLTLITCDGPVDPATGEYASRIVVRARGK